MGDTGGVLEKVYDLPRFLNSDYLVYASGASGNKYARATTQFLESPPAAFAKAHEEVASFPLPDGTTARLIKRIKPLTIEEAEASIKALDLTEAEKSLQFAILAPLYAEEGALYKALAFYEQALQQTSNARSQARYYVAIGDLYSKLNLQDQARESYAQAVELNPSYATASAKLAQLDRDIVVARRSASGRGIVYDFILAFQRGAGMTVETPEKEYVAAKWLTIDNDRKPVLFMHPPSKVNYWLAIPKKDPRLECSLALDPSVWDKEGDGVTFAVIITTKSGSTLAFEKEIDPKNCSADRRWDEVIVDLSPYAGQSVGITFATYPGEDNYWDWAVWGHPVITAVLEQNP